MKNLINTNNLTDAELLRMILGGKNAFTKSEYILNNISIDKILETIPEELKHLYNLSNSQAQNLENFKSFRKRALIKKDLNQIRSSRSNKVIKIEQFSKGGISGTVTDVRILFKNAVLASASGVVVAHNHPSGNLNPTESNSKITAKIKEAGNLLDIQLLDHLIIYDSDYYSFADNGLL
jgi:DNA repair protein RadC